MGWGFLMGLGQGLTQAGGMIQDNYKQKLADKLEQGKEERAQKRADANYERDQLAYKETRPEMDADGVWWNVKYNNAGNPMDKTLAPQSTIESLNSQRQTDRLGLETAILKKNTAQKDYENYDADHALDQDYKRSQIQYNRDRGLGAITGGGRSSNSNSLESTSADEEARVLLDTYSDLVKQYTTPQDKDDPSSARMSQAQAERVALSVIKQATVSGNRSKLGQIFRDALSRQARDTKYANSY